MNDGIYSPIGVSVSLSLEPIADMPALLMKERRTWVCVADLHIGIEVQLRLGGFNIPSQTPRMLSSLEELAGHGSKLLILGDLKHRIPSVGYRENREIVPFMERLGRSFDTVALVSGNHDGGIASILPKSVQAAPGRGTLIENIGAFHGHVWPSETVMEADSIVMGHTHPSVLLVDSLGAKTNEKCWVRARLDKGVVAQRYKHCPKELVIVPAFNPLLTGTPVNSKHRSMIGPVFRNGLVDLKSMRIYLLDGTNLGNL